MRQRQFLIFVLLLLFTALTTACAPQISAPNEPLSIAFDRQSQKVILLPLDSRPACTTMVTRLAQIGNIDVILPDAELLDHYRTPADRTALRHWLQEKVKTNDTLILSADMLLHGSLLQSRMSSLSDKELADALLFLRTLKQTNPDLKLYVFHTIPRLLIADDAKTAKYQKDMLRYSTLQEEIMLFNQEELLEELHELQEDIPPEIIARYHHLYEQNLRINESLLSLVEDHTIDHLVIGQDDGHVFGMPNIVKEQLDRHIRHNPQLAERTQIVRGADELAMLLVSRIHSASSRPLSVCVRYNDDKTGGMVMPFMSQSVNTTVNEKLSSVNAYRTDKIEDADFVLYVYVGNTSHSFADAQDSLQTLHHLDAMDKPIALVDLSEHFRASETLFPTLLAGDFPLHRLIAYAGWNTASNAIGTAVAQAVLYTNAITSADTESDKLAVALGNLTFLNDRFLDDYYYMKLVQPYLKLRLSAFADDPYYLSSESYYEANTWLHTEMQNQARLLATSNSYHLPFKIAMSEIESPFRITELTVKSNLPWERIFEANIFSKIILKNLQKSVDITL